MLEFLPSVYEALGSISVLPEWVGKKCKFVYYINLRSVTAYTLITWKAEAGES